MSHQQRENDRREPTLQQLAAEFSEKRIDWLDHVHGGLFRNIPLSDVIGPYEPDAVGALFVQMRMFGCDFNEAGHFVGRISPEKSIESAIENRILIVNRAMRAVEALAENPLKDVQAFAGYDRDIQNGEIVLGRYANWVRRLEVESPTRVKEDDEDVFLKNRDFIADSIEKIRDAFREIREKAQGRGQKRT